MVRPLPGTLSLIVAKQDITIVAKSHWHYMYQFPSLLTQRIEARQD